MHSVKPQPNLVASAVISAALMGLTLFPAAFPANHSWQRLDEQVFSLVLLPGRYVFSQVFGSGEPWSILLLNWLFYAVLIWPFTGTKSAAK